MRSFFSTFTTVFLVITVLYGDAIKTELSTPLSDSVVSASYTIEPDALANLAARKNRAEAANMNPYDTKMLERDPVVEFFFDELPELKSQSMRQNASESPQRRVTGRIKELKVENGFSFFELVPSYPQNASEEFKLVIKSPNLPDLRPQLWVAATGYFKGTTNTFGKEQMLFAADTVKW